MGGKVEGVRGALNLPLLLLLFLRGGEGGGGGKGVV